MSNRPQQDSGNAKTCTRCKEAKPTIDFYPWSARCKMCLSEAKKEYSKTEGGKAMALRSKKASLARDYHKHRARWQLYDAVKYGRVIKPDTCSINAEECKGRLEAHHDDYSKPLEVSWLCKLHHTQLHYKRKLEGANK